MRIQLFAMATLGLHYGTCSALATTSVLDRKDITYPKDEISTSGPIQHLTARTGIEVRVDLVAAGGIVFSGIAALANYLAIHIKFQSDANSGSVISGNADGAAWQYYASSSGDNHDTTADIKTIQVAVQTCLLYLQSKNEVEGCCQLSHGGTWTGHLQIALDGSPMASLHNKCAFAGFVDI